MCFSFAVAKIVDQHNLFIIPQKSVKKQESAKMHYFSRADLLTGKTLKSYLFNLNTRILNKTARIQKPGLLTRTID